MNSRDYIRRNVREIAPLLKDADHIDIKTFHSEKTMREFIAALLSYQPIWLTFLYSVRWFFVRLLGMKQTGVPKQSGRLQATDIAMTPGEPAFFFKVRAADEARYWFAEAIESHLTAKLGVVAEPAAGQQTIFHVVTVVHYNSWAGPVYFNAIRPFHHLVVASMGRHATQAPVLGVA